MQPSIIYSILVGIWYLQTIIGISGEVRSQNGVGRQPEAKTYCRLEHLTIPGGDLPLSVSQRLPFAALSGPAFC